MAERSLDTVQNARTPPSTTNTSTLRADGTHDGRASMRRIRRSESKAVSHNAQHQNHSTTSTSKNNNYNNNEDINDSSNKPTDSDGEGRCGGMDSVVGADTADEMGSQGLGARTLSSLSSFSWNSDDVLLVSADRDCRLSLAFCGILLHCLGLASCIFIYFSAFFCASM